MGHKKLKATVIERKVWSFVLIFVDGSLKNDSESQRTHVLFVYEGKPSGEPLVS